MRPAEPINTLPPPPLAGSARRHRSSLDPRVLSPDPRAMAAALGPSPACYRRRGFPRLLDEERLCRHRRSATSCRTHATRRPPPPCIGSHGLLNGSGHGRRPPRWIRPWSPPRAPPRDQGDSTHRRKDMVRGEESG